MRGDSIDGFHPGSVYGTQVRPGNREYSGVVDDGDRISGYSRGFPEQTPIEAAMALVLDDFPRDATITRESIDDLLCKIAVIESPTLHDVTGQHAIAAFYSAPEANFDPRDIYDAYVFNHSSNSLEELRC